MTPDQPLPPGGRALGDDPPWHGWTPDHLARRLGRLDVPWYVAGGWAIELAGGVARAHGDLEMAVAAPNFASILSSLPELSFDVVAGPPARAWHVTSGHAPELATTHQTWGRTADGVYRVDVFREPEEQGRWVCRREPSISRAYEQVIRRTTTGIPYLDPVYVMLFKAKHAREKDTADLHGILPVLTDDQRGELRGLLDAVHPGHSWSELI